MLREKRKIRKKLKKYNNPRDRVEFELVRDRCVKMSNDLHSKYILGIESEICRNPKKFWQYIKNTKDHRSSIPAEMTLNDKAANTGSAIANLFAENFSKVYSSDTVLDSAQSLSGKTSCTGLSSLAFTELEVLKKIKQLDIYKGSGPDGIPPLFIKRCATVLALPLMMIFNKSLSDGLYPNEFKRARIIPIYKKNDVTKVSNYRPVSILSCFSKIFESLVCPILSRYVHHSLSIYQHGFIKGRSVHTNLVSFVTDLSSCIDKGAQVDAVYTDFSSAFDKVSHKLLIKKLEHYSIHGTLLDWFRSYLDERLQTVSVNGYESQIYIATSGVPQGSHLGPILFLIFINDICNEIRHCKFSLFADDLKIYAQVNSNNDVMLIQHDLDRIKRWCNDNAMVLNADKCYHIKYTKKKNVIPSTYTLNGRQLEEVSEIRDLGVLIDSSLKFDSHINAVVNKAAKMLGFIRRNTKKFKSPTCKILLYNSLVRSQLEYASTAWSPFYSNQSQRIEGIQRAFTRSLAFSAPNISHRSPYNVRLQFFKMCTLRDRRIIQDVCLLHKILNHNIDSVSNLTPISLNVPSRYPRYPINKILDLPFCKTNTGMTSPVCRMCREYNSLNTQVNGLDIFHDSLNCFKTKLLQFFSK